MITISTNRNKVLVWKPQTLNQFTEISAPYFKSTSIDVLGSVGSGYYEDNPEQGDVYCGFGETNSNGDNADFSTLG